MLNNVLLITAICLCNVAYAGDLSPLERVIVDDEVTHTHYTIEHLPKDLLNKILEFDIVNNPQKADRLCRVCTSWNNCINDKDFTLRILAHNPIYCTYHLKTGMCKKLNKGHVPLQKKLTEDKKSKEDNDEIVHRNECCPNPIFTVFGGGFLGMAIGTGAGGITYIATHDLSWIVPGCAIGALVFPLLLTSINGIRFVYRLHKGT